VVAAVVMAVVVGAGVADEVVVTVVISLLGDEQPDRTSRMNRNRISA
jgi:hypothetical protein